MTSDFLSGALAQAVGWAILHLVWQGAIVAAILAAATTLLRNRSANARYLAACAALAVLPMLFVATVWRCYEPRIADAVTPLAFRSDSLPMDVARAAVVHATRSTIFSAGDLARQSLPTIVLFWLAGVTLLSIRLSVSWSRVHRLAAQAGPASAPWEATLSRIAEALDLTSAVRLLESAAIEVPTVIGWLRPAILLPASTMSGLSPEQIEMLLAHELAHIRRNDFIVNVLQSAVETTFFYHPAVWWISNRIRAEREHCCDDLAVEICGSAVRYARALTRLEELRATRHGLAVAANGGSLISRIRRLVGAPVDATTAAPRWLAGVGVLAVAALALSVPTLPARAERESTAASPQRAEQKTAPPAGSAIAVHAEEVHAQSHIDDHSEIEAHAAADEEIDEPSDVEEAVDESDEVDDETPQAARAAPRPAIAAIMPSMVLAPMGTPVVNPTVAVAPRAMVNSSLTQAVLAGIDGARADTYGSRSRTREFGASGKLTVDELIALRNAGVTPGYIAEMRGAGLGQVTLGEIASMATHGVRASYIRDLRAAGIDLTTARDVTEMRIHGVTSAWIRQMKEAGYRNVSRQELLQLRAIGVTPAFIKAFSDAGYSNLTARELTRLAASGVSPEFIRQISQYRDKK